MTRASTPTTRRRGRLFGALVIGCYLGLAVLVFLPVGPLDASHLPSAGSGDPAQMVWFLAYTPYALAHWHNLFQTNLLDYPRGVNLATNTSVPLLGVLSAPVTMTLGPVATLNLLLRLSLALSAISMYLVLRRFVLPLPARFVGGLLYGFGPYLIGQSEGNAHLDLSFAVIPPVLFLLFYEATAPRRRGALGIGALLGLSAAAQFFVAPEVLAQCALLGMLAFVVQAIRHPSALWSRRRQLAASGLGAVASFGVLVCFPLYELLAGPRRVSGAVQPVAHLQAFSEDLLEPLLPTTRELVAPHGLVALTHFATKNLSELGGYLGLPLLVLVVVLVVLNRSNALIRGCAGLAGAAFVLGLGGRLTVHGHLTPLRLPEALLTHVPLLENTVPSRFGLEVALFSAAVVALGLGELSRRARSPGARGAMWALVGASIIVLAPRLPLDEGTVPWPPSLNATLARAVPAGAVVLTYPYPTPPYDEAMVWQAEAQLRFSLLGGYATVPGHDRAAQLWPVLLQPGAVQSFFSRATAGAQSHLPSVAVPSSALVCSYLRRNGVTNVVYWPHGRDPAVVGALLDETLGTPVATRDGVSVYVTTACSR